VKKELIHVGKFGKPLGLKGEVRIIMFLENIDVFKKLDPYLDSYGKKNWIFEYLKMNGEKLVGKLYNCNSRECVEKFCGHNIYVKKNSFPKIKKNQYYIHDLIDCNVININNKKIGKIKNIENYGAGNLINILKTNGEDFYIPMNEDNIYKINLKEKLIIINPIKGIIN
tara:strand:- start:3360 stop:3866 length:507 start_codon:yes stop_codon:yes gene_type:complete